MTFLKNMFKKKDFDDDLEINKFKPKKFAFEDDSDFSHSLGNGSTKIGESEDYVPPSSYSKNEFDSPLKSAPLQTKPNNDQQIDMMRRDIEVLNAKLDAIRSSLETMGMKIANIEKIALQESNR